MLLFCRKVSILLCARARSHSKWKSHSCIKSLVHHCSYQAREKKTQMNIEKPSKTIYIKKSERNCCTGLGNASRNSRSMNLYREKEKTKKMKREMLLKFFYESDGIYHAIKNLMCLFFFRARYFIACLFDACTSFQLWLS